MGPRLLCFVAGAALSAFFVHVGLLASPFFGSGAFLWVDPVVDRGLACLTDRDYGPWALDAWPALSDAIVTTLVD